MVVDSSARSREPPPTKAAVSAGRTSKPARPRRRRRTGSAPWMRPVVPPDPSKEKAKKEKKKEVKTAEQAEPKAAVPASESSRAARGAARTGGARCHRRRRRRRHHVPRRRRPGVRLVPRARSPPRCRGRWVRPILEDASGPIAATVVFEIRRDGSVADVRIEVSSGVPVMDRSVLRAVLESAPLPALPSSWREPSLSARYEFRFRPGEP